MVAICFHYQGAKPPYSQAFHEADLEYYRHSWQALGVTGMIMIDISPSEIGRHYTLKNKDMSYYRYNSLDEAVAAHGDHQWIYLETEQELDDKEILDGTEIMHFSHLDYVDNVIYCVGPDKPKSPENTGIQDENHNYKDLDIKYNDPRKFVFSKYLGSPYALQMANIVLAARHQQFLFFKYPKLVDNALARLEALKTVQEQLGMR